MSEPVFSVPLDKLVYIEQWDAYPWRWSCYLCFNEYDYGENDHSAASESAAQSAAVAHLESVHGIRAAGGEIDHLRAENKSLSGRLRTLAQLVGGSEVLGITHLPVEEVRKVTGQVSDWEQVDDE